MASTCAARRMRRRTERARRAQLPALARLREVLRYDPRAGVFTRRRGAGRVAGTPDSGGVIQIMIDRRRYAAHRLAWLYVTGETPPPFILHVNGILSDNRFANLRAAAQGETGEGVTWAPRARRYEARIIAGRRLISLGRFATREEGRAAYRGATIVRGLADPARLRVASRRRRRAVC
jgi:Demerecviridae HNH endonuclease